MCLTTLDKKINRKGLTRKDKYVICWKVVNKRMFSKDWVSNVVVAQFRPGWNISRRKRKVSWRQKYIYHFHAYMSKSAAKRHCHSYDTVIRCKTFLKHITVTGKQRGNVLVTTKIWIPPCPEVQ